MGTPTRRRAGRRLDDERLFLNRELSWLDFNGRVIELASDPSLPLLERLKFCAIYSNNLDEFFMVRVAGLLDHVARSSTPSDGTPPRRTLHGIAERVRAYEAVVERLLHGDILPALARHGIELCGVEDLSREERAYVDDVFRSRIYPVLTPLAVGPGRPFPYISNLSLSIGAIVSDPTSGERRFARVKVPEVLRRYVAVGEGLTRYVLLEDVIAAHLSELFPGMTVDEHANFRVTRDADFEIPEDQEDLLEAVEQELSRRRFGDVVRLEVERRMSQEMRAMLARALDVYDDQVYDVEPPLDVADFMTLAAIDRPELRDEPWSGQTQPRLLGDEDDEEVDLFAIIREGDIMVHHPYDAFSTSVERFIEQAVDDPDVLAIKHTIYRTSGDSPIVPALIRAAEQGKQAVVLVELKARFDEEKNIRWARSLERAGVHVVHGVAGLKTHCKLALVVRREGHTARRYVHIGTGNYHPSTARLYTDVGLFTCREDVTEDVGNLFNYMTGFALPQHYDRLLVAPHELRDGIIDQIRRCIDEHTDAAPSRIVMKMNALVDRRVIMELYRASQAGVPIELYVRGICCLRPGVPGVSDTIHVTSVLGRFLEHSRVYRFEAASGSATYIGSADLMPRNLDARIEVVTPVDDPVLAQELVESIDLMAKDTVGAWRLDAEGVWRRVLAAEGEEPFSSQEANMQRALRSADAAERRAFRREAAARKIRRRPNVDEAR